ncbi:MAG: DUF3179 domain-containing (seleno)protein [Candidatus Bathyarchaeia archaeon]
MKHSNVRKAIAIAALAVILVAAIAVMENPFGNNRPIFSTSLFNPGVATSHSQTLDFYNLQVVLAAKEGALIGVRGESLQVTNGVRHLVSLENIVSGGPPPDGIPSIDDPKFIAANEADKLLSDEDFVLGVVYNEIARAYPHQILAQHEIVNDNFNGKHLVVTFCPLCFTGIAFEPTIDGEPVEFGTSGKLYNSDLVMYDRKTGSYWSQITGQAIKGELTGLVLRQVPLDTIRWGDWKKLYPDTEVLSRDTGFDRFYDQDPYSRYYHTGVVSFPVESNDTRLPAKAVVYGIYIDGRSKAYPEDEIARAGGVINDVVGSISLLIVQDPSQVAKPVSGFGSDLVSSKATRVFDRTLDGTVLDFEINDGKLRDKQTGSLWSFAGKGISGGYQNKELTRMPSSPEFWFARASFYPETTIFSTSPTNLTSVEDLENDPTTQVLILSQQLQPGRILSRVVGELQNTGLNILTNITLTVTVDTAANSDLHTAITPPVVSLVGHSLVQDLLPGQKSPFEILHRGIVSSATDVKVLSFDVATNPPYQSIFLRNVTGYLDTGGTKPSTENTRGFYGRIPSFHVTGDLENVGLTTAKQVRIVVTFYDKEGEMVDGMFWFSRPLSIKPGQSGEFEIVTRLRANEIASFIVQYTTQTS